MDAPHPRFFSRITSDEEKDVFEDNLSTSLMLWAAKESAYKAFCQIDSKTKGIPRLFEVSSDFSSVSYLNDRLQINITNNGDYIFAEAYKNCKYMKSKVVNSVENQQSQAAREALWLLLEDINPEFDRVQYSLEKIDGIPLLKHKGIYHHLSFTHHGTFAAASIISSF